MHSSVADVSFIESNKCSSQLSKQHKMFPSHKTIKKIPLSRVELHVHLDGSLRYETIWELAKEKHITLPGDGTLADLKKALVIRDPIDLHHFLEPFLIFTPCVVGDLKAIERIAYEFCEDKARNGVLYAEARYGPHFWFSSGDCRGNLQGLGEVVQAVTRGFTRGEEDFGIKVRTILCALNGTGTATDVLHLCQTFRNEGVVGMDLAAHCTSESKSYVEVPLNPEELSAFNEARKTGIHRTLHAGESGGPEMVERAIVNYFAERVGHGYHVLQDKTVYETVREKDIHLETCPYSSLLTGSVPLSSAKHPIVRFAEDNVNFSINTDDTTMTGVNLQSDYDLTQSWGLTEVHFVRSNLNAARSCFLPEPEKSKLLNELKGLFGFHEEIH